MCRNCLFPECACNMFEPWFDTALGKAWLHNFQNILTDQQDRMADNVIDVRNVA